MIHRDRRRLAQGGFTLIEVLPTYVSRVSGEVAGHAGSLARQDVGLGGALLGFRVDQDYLERRARGFAAQRIGEGQGGAGSVGEEAGDSLGDAWAEDGFAAPDLSHEGRLAHLPARIGDPDWQPGVVPAGGAHAAGVGRGSGK